MSKLNKDQIYADAVSKCKKIITLEYIKEIIADDKTNTIKKYHSSYGPLQLAFHLQGLARALHPPKNLAIGIESPKDNKRRYNPLDDGGDELSVYNPPAHKYGVLSMKNKVPKYSKEVPPLGLYTGAPNPPAEELAQPPSSIDNVIADLGDYHEDVTGEEYYDDEA